MKHEIKQDDVKYSKVHQNDTSNGLLTAHFPPYLYKEI